MKKIYAMGIVVVSLLLILFAFFNLYQNSKTDGYNRGSIEVTRCQEKNWAWRIYECTGDYTSGVGMIGKRNVTVTVTGDELHKGDVVYDVYPPTFHSKMDTDHFVTGKERSSVLYNTPWLLLLFISTAAPLSMTLYALGSRHARR